MKITLNELAKYHDREYEGYIWLSDKTSPKVLIGKEKTFDFSPYLEEDANPFIIEALLYCKVENKSYIIKHTHEYVVREIKIDELEKEREEKKGEIEKIEHLPHKLGGVDKLCFAQYWLPEEDPLCNDFPVLKLKATVFTGFEPKN